MVNFKHLVIKPQFFWLNVAILLHAEYILQLMKQQTDQLLVPDENLQAFLTWVSQKSRTVTTRYKLVIVRAFYFDLALARALALVGGTFDLARALDLTLTCNMERTLALDLALDRVLGFDQVFALTHNSHLVFELVLERAKTHAHAFEPMLEQALQQLKQLPDWGRDGNRFKQWWSIHSQAWTEQTRAVMIEYRDLGHNWQFSKQQKKALKQYYDANQLLVDCLNRDCYMTPRICSQTESTLFLPIAEIAVLIS